MSPDGIMEDMKEIRIQLEEGARVPSYGTAQAAGADLHAFLDHPITIGPHERAMVPTGIRMAIPEGYEVQIRPRSGLAAKHGITVLNSPGTIDADYRGEVKVILINHSDEPFTVNNGDRIAQMVIARCERADFAVCTDLDETARGEGGFGSTGK